MVYLPTFTLNLSQMKVNIPYMDPMGVETEIYDSQKESPLLRGSIC